MSSKNGHLTIEQILAAQDAKVEAVDVPEWGGKVYLRSISGNARDMIEDKVSKGVVVGLRAQLVAAAMCNGEGEPIKFEPQQVAELGTKNAIVLDRLFAVAQRLSGIGADDSEGAEGN